MLDEKQIIHGFPSEEDWLLWKKRRRNTIIGFVLVGTVVGIDDSLVFNTLFLYLKDRLHTDNPQLWYGVIIATYFTSSAIFGGICGRFVDKTRRIRLYLNFALLIQVVGFIIYAIPYSSYNLLLGRFLCGIGEPFIGVVTGEVFRIYGGEESNQAMIWLASTFSFGYIIGPCLNMIFVSVDFHIGWIRVTVVNFTPIFMTFCLLGIAVLANFLVSDCSAEFDLKEFLVRKAEETKEEEEEEEGEEEKNETKEGADETCLIMQKSYNEDGFISVKRLIYTLSINIDALFILCSSFLLEYALIVANMWIPLILFNTLKWGIRGTSYFYFGYGIGTLLVLMVLCTRDQSNASVYYISVVSAVGSILVFVIIFILQVMTRSFWIDVGLVVFLVITFIFSFIFEDICSRVILGSMVPSQVQSFTESLRCGVARFGIIAGSFSSTFLFSHLASSCIALLSNGIVILVFLLVRWKQLIDPKKLKFDKTY